MNFFFKILIFGLHDVFHFIGAQLQEVAMYD